MPDPAVIDEIHRLRAEDVHYRVIAQRVGLAKSTVFEILADSDGKRAWRRKHNARCPDCDRPIYTATSHRKSPYCRDCTAVHRREQARAYIIQRIHDWVEIFGQPPTASDWNASAPLSFSAGARRARVADQHWPNTGTVQYQFGSWNAGIRAAGFLPRPTGSHGG